MAKSRRNLILRYAALFTLYLFGSTLTAEELREVTFSVYGQYPLRNIEYAPVSAEAIAAGQAEKPPIQLSSHILSRHGEYTHLGSDQITFQSSQDQSIIASVTLPKTSDKWLLIFVKNPKYNAQEPSGNKYFIYPFDDRNSNLPKDSLIFLNISGKELDGLVEKTRVQLELGESEYLPIQQSLPINLWSRANQSEKLLPALIKTYKFEAGKRYLLVFFPPVLRGSSDLDVRLLAD